MNNAFKIAVFSFVVTCAGHLFASADPQKTDQIASDFQQVCIKKALQKIEQHKVVESNGLRFEERITQSSCGKGLDIAFAFIDMVGKKHAYVEAFMQKSSHVVRLDALEVVDPALRGKGLAEYLAYRVYVLCKKFGCTKIVGSAESFGDHAIPHGALLGFYAKLGARVVGKTFAGCNTKIEFTLPSSGLIASKL